MMNYTSLIYALIGGIFPALVWLLFWLHEDYKHPEPKGLIGKTFIFGMLAVIAVLPFQKAVEHMMPNMIVPMVFLWAMFEEVFKFVAGYFGGLASKEDNEPIDPIIYMVTAALGFVALENTLFILGPILGNDLARSIITGNMRFIGASLLHVVSSGFVGVALSFMFYQKRWLKVGLALVMLGIAIVFHSMFNLFILNGGDAGSFVSFLSVWSGVVALLLAFEKAKTIAPR